MYNSDGFEARNDSDNSYDSKDGDTSYSICYNSDGVKLGMIVTILMTVRMVTIGYSHYDSKENYNRSDKCGDSDTHDDSV